MYENRIGLQASFLNFSIIGKDLSCTAHSIGGRNLRDLVFPQWRHIPFEVAWAVRPHQRRNLPCLAASNSPIPISDQACPPATQHRVGLSYCTQPLMIGIGRSEVT